VNVAGTRGPAAGGGAIGVWVCVLLADVVVFVFVARVVVCVVVDEVVVETVADACCVSLCVTSVVLECDEPPHPASTSAHTSPEQISFGLTFPAYSADIRRIDEAAQRLALALTAAR
jgi:hypothetical protein